jgi:hypothetical protein
MACHTQAARCDRVLRLQVVAYRRRCGYRESAMLALVRTTHS